MTAEFRHVTNLQTPYDELDTHLLENIGDGNYVIGDPIKANNALANSVDRMKANGVVGLYATYDAIGAKSVRNQTGWVIPNGTWQKLPLLPQ